MMMLDHCLLKGVLRGSSGCITTIDTYESGKFGGDGEEEVAKPVNKNGVKYSDIIDIKTGEPLIYPGDNLEIVPENEKAKWYRSRWEADNNRTTPGEILCKIDFIDEWYNRGFETPEEGRIISNTSKLNHVNMEDNNV